MFDNRYPDQTPTNKARLNYYYHIYVHTYPFIALNWISFLTHINVLYSFTHVIIDTSTIYKYVILQASLINEGMAIPVN